MSEGTLWKIGRKEAGRWTTRRAVGNPHTDNYGYGWNGRSRRRNPVNDFLMRLARNCILHCLGALGEVSLGRSSSTISH